MSPHSGTTVLDAGVIIGVLNDADAHHEAATDAIKQLADAGSRLAMSAVTLSEILVQPSRQGRQVRDAVHFLITHTFDVSIIDVSERLADEIAWIRAHERVSSTPDAAVVATASSVGAERILTTDRKLARHESAVTPEQFLRR